MRRRRQLRPVHLLMIPVGIMAGWTILAALAYLAHLAGIYGGW